MLAQTSSARWRHWTSVPKWSFVSLENGMAFVWVFRVMNRVFFLLGVNLSSVEKRETTLISSRNSSSLRRSDQTWISRCCRWSSSFTSLGVVDRRSEKCAILTSRTLFLLLVNLLLFSRDLFDEKKNTVISILSGERLVVCLSVWIDDEEELEWDSRGNSVTLVEAFLGGSVCWRSKSNMYSTDRPSPNILPR